MADSSTGAGSEEKNADVVERLLERVAHLERRQRRARAWATSALVLLAALVTLAAVRVKSADFEIWPNPFPGGAGDDSARLRMVGNDSANTPKAMQLQNVTDNATPDEYRLDIQDDGGTPRVTVDDDGNVGIGVTAPGARLDIAGDGQTVLFPRKSTAGDPAGSNGMVYYNANSNKFRVFENGTWNDLVVQPTGGGWSDDGAIVRLLTATDRVGIGTAAPDGSAALEIVSTTRAFLPPRMTQGQRDSIVAPKRGMIVYDTTSDELNVYDGANWVALTTVAPSAGQTPTIYGANGGAGGLQIITIDRTTGIATLVGSGTSAVVGLAYNRNTGVLYGVASTGDDFLIIEKSTGATTNVGNLGFTIVEGLAFDPNTNTLYGSDISTDQLIRINTATGAGTAVGPLGLASVEGLAFDPNTNTLYGTDLGIDKIVTINTATGAASQLGATLGYGQVAGLAVASTPVPAPPPPLYASDTGLDELITIDRNTGVGTSVGALGYARVEGLAYNRNTGVLYGSDVPGNRIIIINKSTGASMPVGATGFASVDGLDYDPNTNTLYGTDTSTDQLIRINTGTGVGTAIGPLGFTDVSGLAFDPNTNTLYGSNNSTDQLIRINTATGAGTAIGPLGFTGVEGLAFDPNTNILYGVDITTDRLLTINTATGAASQVAGVLGFLIVYGLAPNPD
ncbi:MAG: hypothetical protein HY720_05240 [Planctomycetes bacterium]|nr:hypothetical protein [Planctomycetota bacterium]